MTINKNQGVKDGNDSEISKPYFYNIILSPLAQKSKLMIPKEFVKKYGRRLTNDIYINVPNSEQPWKMMLEKSNNNMFLGKGWQIFMEFYRLEYGHFLLFRLHGGLPSQFDVLIFDMSATEIDYPVRSSSSSSCNTMRSIDGEQVKSHVKEERIEEDEDDDSVEILEEMSPKLNNVASTVNLDDTSDSSDGVACSSSGDGVECSSSRDDVECSISSDRVECSGFKGKGCTMIAPDMRKKLKRKLDGITSQHPHFKVIIYPSHVGGQRKMHVPFKHASIYFPSDLKEIILKGPNGKSHLVSFYLGKNSAELVGGWRKFSLDNDLEIGDTCMFELIDRRSTSYKVSIFRSYLE